MHKTADRPDSIRQDNRPRARLLKNARRLGAGLICAGIALMHSIPASAAESKTERGDGSRTTKTVIGWAEKIKVYPGNVLLQAKMIPGDEGTAIDARKIKPFKKGEDLWVSFYIKDRSGEKLKLEREVLRTIRVKRGNDKSEVQYLVQLGLCIGNVYEEADVILADRSRRQHKAIIGRNVLASHFIVDPSQAYTKEPTCREADNQEAGVAPGVEKSSEAESADDEAPELEQGESSSADETANRDR